MAIPAGTEPTFAAILADVRRGVNRDKAFSPGKVIWNSNPREGLGFFQWLAEFVSSIP
jgi:hypothetical protein